MLERRTPASAPCRRRRLDGQRSRLTIRSSRVQVEDCFERAAADSAKADRVAAEHDAIGLRTVVTLRQVVRSLERANLAGPRTAIEHGGIAVHLLPEERVH